MPGKVVAFPRIRRTPVHSSSIASVGYDARTGMLDIEFRENGHVYRYEAVPEHVFTGLLQADSKGGYVNAFIRDAYRYRRID